MPLAAPAGPEAAKNAHAAGLLLRLLRGAVWLNVHHMPPSSHVLELRLQEVRAELSWGAPLDRPAAPTLHTPHDAAAASKATIAACALGRGGRVLGGQAI